VISKRNLIFAPELASALNHDPFLVVDVGARAGVDEPWSDLPANILRTVGFEPDGAEAHRLSMNDPRSQIHPVALWSRHGEVEANVAEDPSCSSVHPPNLELLRRYPDKHAAPRRTRARLRFPSAALDDALAEEPRCDFLKIDTQGAELEILQGATAVLERKVFAVLVETWTTEVHTGQGLTGDVMRLMADRGMELFDTSLAAAWHRRVAESEALGGRRQVIGLDLLFMRDPGPLSPPTAVLKAAAIAEVFGFPDFALELLLAANLSAGTLSWAHDRILRNGAHRSRLRSKLATRALELLGHPRRPFAALH
jgi:FkbM family methyltransferase